MEARILNKAEEKKWDNFIATHPLSTIHQFSYWGHFQEKISERGKYWIVVLEEKGKIIGGTMLIRHKIKKGYTWLYSARGPLLDYSSDDLQKQIDELLNVIKKIAKEEKSIFIRIDPPLTSDKQIRLKGFKKAHGFQPEHTLIINLDLSEDEILAQMKQKGRYNIRLAEKKGVTVRISDPQNKGQFEKDIHRHFEILQETTSRDGFHGHDENFYKTMVETLYPSGKLYLAEFEGEILAGIIVTFFKDTAIYYYGASGNIHRELMAPYLLQWQAIKDTKSQGFKYYDFLGIAPANAKNHPWLGVTEFKKKFGGNEVSYLPPMEFSFKKLFHLGYRLYKTLRK